MASGTATFTWTAETGGTSYQIWIGNSPGAKDILTRGTNGLTLAVSGIPTDRRTLYVTLYGYAGGVWTVQDSATYMAATKYRIGYKPGPDCPNSPWRKWRVFCKADDVA